ncbi:MAG: cyclodeaminase/cyclohydrolase family protein [Clostridia bacterium]|nr:cyclodeaminase/cyclohydrolase family protein [Clostridia bacterium]
MERLIDLTVTEFTEVLASDAPAPGGGSVAALLGACGASLAVMTANLTIGKKKYADHWKNAEAAKTVGEPLIEQFRKAIDDDTLAFNKLYEAMHLPKETDEQKAARRAAIEETTKEAANLPFHTLSLCEKTVTVLEQLAGRINPNCASDFGVGAASIVTAARGAWLNVCINLQGLSDEAFVQDLYDRAKAIYDDVTARADALYQAIDVQCRPVCNQIEG